MAADAVVVPVETPAEQAHCEARFWFTDYGVTCDLQIHSDLLDIDGAPEALVRALLHSLEQMVERRIQSAVAAAAMAGRVH